MHYFKVITGFGAEDYISVDESEIEKAIYAQLAKVDVVFRIHGPYSGKIFRIVPDWHRSMGWNHGYKLQPEDMAEIRGKFRKEERLIELATANVLRHMQEGRADLIGKEMLRLDDSKTSETVERLAEGMRLA